MGLLTLVAAGVSGMALETPIVATGGGRHASSPAPANHIVHAKLAAVPLPCGFGSNGGGLPLPPQYLVNGSTDQGVDYGAPPDTPECALGDGVVVGNGINGFGPWAPILQINDGPLAGRFVYYGHAGPDGLVSAGTPVANGQEVSSVGAGIVGISTGPHLEIGFWCPLAGQPPNVGNPCGDGGDMLNYINSELGPSNCTFYGVNQVCGAIRDKFLNLGGPAVLGNPVTNETATPDGVGRFNYFSNHWAIYWTPATGAWSIHGDILDKWASLGWEHGFLGYPITDELGTPNKLGRFNTFTGHGGIYWTPTTGAWSIHGAIFDHWGAMGWENSVLGFPTTDELTTPNKVAQFNVFTGDGGIYWTPAAGAWSIHGAIFDRWASLGWENSFLGVPVTDETGTPDHVGRFNHFSSTHSLADVNGSIYWTPAVDAHEVHGLIRVKWAAMGWERSCLGYPTSNETAIPGGRENTFQHGAITFNAATVQTTSSC